MRRARNPYAAPMVVTPQRWRLWIPSSLAALGPLNNAAIGEAKAKA